MIDDCRRSGFDAFWCATHGAHWAAGSANCQGKFLFGRLDPEPFPRPKRRSVGPCPCACNSGGFCGGCGHAGCSGGINLR